MTTKERGKQIRSAMPEAYKMLENFQFSRATDAVAQLLLTIAAIMDISLPAGIVEHFSQMFTIVDYPIGEGKSINISELVFRDNERHSEFSLNRDFKWYKRQSTEEYIKYLRSTERCWTRPDPMKIELYNGLAAITMCTGNKIIPVIRLDYDLFEIKTSNFKLGRILDDTVKTSDFNTDTALYQHKQEE